jgi:protein TonB
MTIGLNPFLNKQNAQPSRRFDAAQSAAARHAERSNVVVLSQRKRAGDNDNSGLHIAPGDGARPTHETSRLRRTLYWTTLIGVVLLLHSAVVFAFLGHTKPQASVGLESISVEVVLGAQTAAGLASAPSESEAAASEPASEPTPPEPEITEKTPETPQPVVEAEALKRSKPVDKPRPQKTQPKRQVASTAPASTASSGIGQGRSSADSNYLGLVAAHLTKHKRFPPEASATGSTGVTTITFTIDGQGNFVSAQLAQSSGVPSLDAETQEMVRRASPFPAPPSGQMTSFTVPVNFSLKN